MLSMPMKIPQEMTTAATRAIIILLQFFFQTRARRMSPIVLYLSSGTVDVAFLISFLYAIGCEEKVKR